MHKELQGDRQRRRRAGVEQRFDEEGMASGTGKRGCLEGLRFDFFGVVLRRADRCSGRATAFKEVTIATCEAVLLVEQTRASMDTATSGVRV